MTSPSTADSCFAGTSSIFRMFSPVAFLIAARMPSMPSAGDRFAFEHRAGAQRVFVFVVFDVFAIGALGFLGCTGSPLGSLSRTRRALGLRRWRWLVYQRHIQLHRAW